MQRFVCLLLLAACGAPSAPATAPAPAPSVAAAPVAAPLDSATILAADRSDADKALDAGRKPVELMTFLGIGRGAKVAELVAGGGYTAEILARTVGDTGVVYGENPHAILEKFAEKPWAARLEKPIMHNVRRVDRELESPLPPEAKDLDAVLCVLFYHDTVWLKVDRAAMNRAVFASLKSGGVYGIVDHSARAGTGLADVQTLHRIDENTLVDEITQAGFVLQAHSDVWKNPTDTRDWSASPGAAAQRRGTSDRFALKFVKP